MATLTYPATIVGGTTEDVSQLNSNLTAIQNVVNALDDANISATAGIQGSKLATGATGLAQGAFSAYRNVAVALATGSVVAFDTKEFDVSGWFDITTNIGRYTPQVPGYYRLSSLVSSRDVQVADVAWVPVLRKNGVNFKNGMVGAQRNSTTPVSGYGSWDVQANGTTDFFDVIISHTAGAATFVFGGAIGTYFQGELIGRS